VTVVVVVYVGVFELLNGQNILPDMLSDRLLVRVKDAFHELLRVVHTHPIQGNEQPDDIRLVFDSMKGDVILEGMYRVGADSICTTKTTQILRVSSPLY
jgi:hypothetical protein